MFNNFWQFLSHILYNQGGYIGKAKKAQWKHDKAIADQQAAVLREQIASNERIQREVNAATERAARNTAIGGVLGAAIGANQTVRQIKQLLPHERIAAQISAVELGQKWRTSREMKESGYSNVAIEYALNGKKHTALYGDAEYSTMMMKTQQRKDMIQNIQTFGIQSASNPYGVSMSADEFIEMHALKDPESMLHVDPKVARERQAAFDKWEADMKSQGRGILVDLYKNPGKSVLAMKGKDPLISPEIAEFMKPIVGSGGGEAGDVDWNAAFIAAQRGEDTPFSKEIKWAMQNGFIDEYGVPDMDAIIGSIPPDIYDTPAFDPVRQLTDAEKAKLLDDYNKFSEIQIDPKLVREKQIGMGVTEKIKMNADGTVSGKIIEGYMTAPDGSQIFMSLPNASLRDWKAKESQMLSGLGPNFPGQLALSTQDEMHGTHLGASRKNQMARPNTQGMAGPQMTSAKNPYGEGHKPNQQQPAAPAPTFVSGLTMAKPGSGTATKPSASTGSNPAAEAGGAPLAAGED